MTYRGVTVGERNKPNKHFVPDRTRAALPTRRTSLYVEIIVTLVTSFMVMEVTVNRRTRYTRTLAQKKMQWGHDEYAAENQRRFPQINVRISSLSSLQAKARRRQF